MTQPAKALQIKTENQSKINRLVRSQLFLVRYLNSSDHSVKRWNYGKRGHYSAYLTASDDEKKPVIFSDI